MTEVDVCRQWCRESQSIPWSGFWFRRSPQLGQELEQVRRRVIRKGIVAEWAQVFRVHENCTRELVQHQGQRSRGKLVVSPSVIRSSSRSTCKLSSCSISSARKRLRGEGSSSIAACFLSTYPAIGNGAGFFFGSGGGSAVGTGTDACAPGECQHTAEVHMNLLALTWRSFWVFSGID